MSSIDVQALPHPQLRQLLTSFSLVLQEVGSWGRGGRVDGDEGGSHDDDDDDEASKRPAIAAEVRRRLLVPIVALALELLTDPAVQETVRSMTAGRSSATEVALGLRTLLEVVPVAVCMEAFEVHQAAEGVVHGCREDVGSDGRNSDGGRSGRNNGSTVAAVEVVHALIPPLLHWGKLCPETVSKRKSLTARCVTATPRPHPEGAFFPSCSSAV